MNGIAGASSLLSVARHSCRVEYAARSESVISPSDFQNRRRERRSHQFESASTNRSMGRVAAVTSYCSYASVTSRTSVCSSERIHLSSGLRALAGASCPGFQCARFAYVTKNEYVFHSGSMKLRTTSPTRSTEKRRELPGGEAVYKYQRKASAPLALSTLHGSTMLPFDFDIFCPSPSRMGPRQITFLNDTSSNNSVAMACSE